MLNPPGPVLRFALRLPRYLYKWKLGWVLGHRFLLIIHRGRRSGALHQTVVEVLHYDASSREAVVMSGWGSRSDWFRNIQAAGFAEVVIGRRRFPATHRVLGVEEASRILADYEGRNRWITPVVRKVLGALVGWNYDGSEQGRRSLVRQLPLVAFRPEVAWCPPADRSGRSPLAFLRCTTVRFRHGTHSSSKSRHRTPPPGVLV